MWSTKELDLGKIKDTSNALFSFKYFGTKKIKYATASCGCTSPVVKDNNEIVGSIKIKPVSKMLPAIVYKDQKHYNQEQTVTVTFDDGSVDYLTVKAIIIE